MKKLGQLGYSIYKHGDTTIIFKPPLAPDAIPVHGQIGRPSPLKGRGRIKMLLPDMVVRDLTHGGMLGPITGDRFLSPSRSLRELTVSAYLVAQHVRTPDVLGLRFVKYGLFYHISVITRLVPDSIDFLTYLEQPQQDASAILTDVGRLVRRIHDLQVYHADLHLKNILLDKDHRPWILDLDKAWHLKKLPLIFKSMNFKRFYRSCRKWKDKGRIILPMSYEAFFIKGYLEYPSV